MKKFLALATILSLGLYATESSAQLFRLRTTDYGNLTGPQQSAWNTALTDVEASINKDFPSSTNPNRLMQGMANSSVMAGKGIGSDYASRMEVALLGVGVGGGADMEKDKTTNSDLSGVGIQGGIVIGGKSQARKTYGNGITRNASCGKCRRWFFGTRHSGNRCHWFRSTLR